MSMIEKYANYVNTEGIIALFDKYQKSLGDNRALAAKECDITPKSVYDWEALKENVKHSTKVRVLEKIIEDLPVETFSYLTQNLYDSSTETLMSCLTTLYEMSFDAKDENEYLQKVKEFENITEKYGGLIYKHRELEVNHMFSKLSTYAKSQNYLWKPHQTILYDSERVKQMISQLINLWAYYGLPTTPEEIASRHKFPLEIVKGVKDGLKQNLLAQPSLESDKAVKTSSEDEIRVGIYFQGDDKTIMSTAATIRKPERKPLEINTSQV